MSDTYSPNKNRLLTAEEERLWSNAIGGVFLNFGSIEFTSLRWIESLSTDIIMRDIASDMSLSKRINLIKQLVKRSTWTPKRKKNAVDLWNKVSTHSEIRNTIAHNPFIFSQDQTGKPTNGIINVKKMKGAGPYEIQLLDVNQIIETAHQARQLSYELNSLWAKPHDEN